jgi:hypothetical protein
LRVRPSLFIALCALVLASACSDDDPFRPVATTPNVITGLSLAPLSAGTAAPTALDLINLRAVRPVIDAVGTVNFQLAFDLDPQNRVLLLPVLAMLSPPTGSASVGLLRTTGTFEQASRAPTGGFVSDSSVTAAVGETWVVRLNAGTCAFGDPFYGKLVVDEVNTGMRRLLVRFLINRNCGYRDLVEGLPRN